MLIGVISDTHDNAVNLIKAVELFNERNVDLVVHCGDWVSPFMPNFCKNLKARMISVFGNNERELQLFVEKFPKIEFHKTFAELELDNKKVFVYHGDSKPLLSSVVDSGKFDVVFSGHTHIPCDEMKGKTLHLNPGSICGIRGSEVGIMPTVAIYNTKKNTADVIELK